MKRLLTIAIALVAACAHHEDKHAAGGSSTVPLAPAGAPKLVVTSTAFSDRGELPVDHTCEGADVAPPLAWSGAPAGTKAFAIIVDDPDAPDPSAPKQTWVHWVLVNIPANVTSLPAGAGVNPPAGAANGTNDWGKAAWGGACPPIGRHRYFFKVYALDAAIGQPGISKSELLKAIEGHVLAQGELVGTYQKKKP